MIYENDKRVRITLRLNEEQFAFVKASADVIGVSPSDFLRQVINATMYASKNIDVKAQVKENNCRENEIANINDKL